MNGYKETKENVLCLYDEFVRIADELGVSESESMRKALASQAEKIKADKYTLVVAGEAKSGMSTFINAYLGEDILPMDVKQCTCAVIKVCYGESVRFKAVYADESHAVIEGKEDVKIFLEKHAALCDEYRDIPVSVINDALILKKKGKKIHEYELQDLLKGIEKENIYRLAPEEYEKKVRAYIEKEKENWKELVVEMELEYPFRNQALRNIQMIDTPGVNAVGRLGDLAEPYLKSADAILFVRPLTGVSIEDESFKNFLESNAMERHKNTMFLVLSRSASESKSTVQSAYEEFSKMFGAQKIESRYGISNNHILAVDSKAELYFHLFRDMPWEMINKVMEENSEEMEAFLEIAWLRAKDDKAVFLKNLKAHSNFDTVDQAFNRFGRNAHFIRAKEFLKRLEKAYEKLEADLKEKLEYYSLKAENPSEMALKMAEMQMALTKLENDMNEGIDGIIGKYSGSGKNGCIVQRAEKVMAEYSEAINHIDGTGEQRLEELEKLSLQQVDVFREFESELQKEVMKECSEKLITLSEEHEVPYITLEPDFSQDTIEEIKNSMRAEATETYTYTTGWTFKETHSEPRFSQSRYYRLVKGSIEKRMEKIKRQAIRDLRLFVRKVAIVYVKELEKNAESKRKALSEIKNKKMKADEIIKMLESMKGQIQRIRNEELSVKTAEEGIEACITKS